MKNIAERNLDLVMRLMQFLLDQPQVLDRLPPNFQLVLLPDDDPELARYNFDLLEERGTEDPIVFVRLTLHPMDFTVHPPRVYAPVPV